MDTEHKMLKGKGLQIPCVRQRIAETPVSNPEGKITYRIIFNRE
jgi:hypothetical protein